MFFFFLLLDVDICQVIIVYSRVLLMAKNRYLHNETIITQLAHAIYKDWLLTSETVIGYTVDVNTPIYWLLTDNNS